MKKGDENEGGRTVTRNEQFHWPVLQKKKREKRGKNTRILDYKEHLQEIRSVPRRETKGEKRRFFLRFTIERTAPALMSPNSIDLVFVI
jgi:hypothetical protein